MPETDCTVTAICGDGSRYTMTVRAKSVYYAVLAYNAEACCRSSAGFPRSAGTFSSVMVTVSFR